MVTITTTKLAMFTMPRTSAVNIAQEIKDHNILRVEILRRHERK